MSTSEDEARTIYKDEWLRSPARNATLSIALKDTDGERWLKVVVVWRLSSAIISGFNDTAIERKLYQNSRPTISPA